MVSIKIITIFTAIKGFYLFGMELHSLVKLKREDNSKDNQYILSNRLIVYYLLVLLMYLMMGSLALYYAFSPDVVIYIMGIRFGIVFLGVFVALILLLINRERLESKYLKE